MVHFGCRKGMWFADSAGLTQSRSSVWQLLEFKSLMVNKRMAQEIVVRCGGIIFLVAGRHCWQCFHVAKLLRRIHLLLNFLLRSCTISSDLRSVS